MTVPKRTGRKRKRGSDEPYVGDADVSMRNTSTEDGEIIGSNCATSKFHSTPKDTAYLLQSLRDNVDKYKVEPVGIIEQTHRFRGNLISISLILLMKYGWLFKACRTSNIQQPERRLWTKWGILSYRTIVSII